MRAILLATLFLFAHPAFALKTEITVKQLPSGQEWEVEYRFSEPVKRLGFERNVNLFREKEWKLQTPNLQIKREDGHEVLTSSDGREFQVAKIYLRSYTAGLIKDYDFFIPFTDSSQIMYTGHFYLYPLRADGKFSWNNEFRLRFLSENRIFFLGQGYENQAEWFDQSADGTYVYFGEIAPLETDLFVGIIDPGLPAWLKDMLFTYMPKLIALYHKEFAQEFKQRPIIYFSNNINAESNGSGGGVLPGVVQLQVRGKGWNEQTPKNREDSFFLLAHESAHLWNAELFRYSDDFKASWMHEGHATAAAWRAASQLGFLSDERINEIFSQELNDCIKRLKFPLNEAADHREFKAYYDCGSTIGLMTEAALRVRNPSASLSDFWRELFAAAPNRKYGQTLYLSTLARLTGETETSAAIEELAMKGVASVKDFFWGQLRRLGVPVSERDGQLVIQGYRP